MLWEVKVLPKPATFRASVKSTSDKSGKGTAQEAEDAGEKTPALTVWNDQEHGDESQGYSLNQEAVNFHKGNPDILFYPDNPPAAKELRNTFYMQKRKRPMVPAPTGCPMPDKQRSGERRDRLYLLYLQPWVLEASWEVPKLVPHLSRLNRVEDPERDYSYSNAWNEYIQHNIVSRHAHRIIVQFMAACCGNKQHRATHTRSWS